MGGDTIGKDSIPKSGVGTVGPIEMHVYHCQSINVELVVIVPIHHDRAKTDSPLRRPAGPPGSAGSGGADMMKCLGKIESKTTSNTNGGARANGGS
jgi:hypothetical protein